MDGEYSTLAMSSVLGLGTFFICPECAARCSCPSAVCVLSEYLMGFRFDFVVLYTGLAAESSPYILSSSVLAKVNADVRNV